MTRGVRTSGSSTLSLLSLSLAPTGIFAKVGAILQLCKLPVSPLILLPLFPGSGILPSLTTSTLFSTVLQPPIHTHIRNFSIISEFQILKEKKKKKKILGWPKSSFQMTNRLSNSIDYLQDVINTTKRKHNDLQIQKNIQIVLTVSNPATASKTKYKLMFQ